MKNEIFVLCGHTIPKQPYAIAVFIGKPTKEQLLNLPVFEDGELSNKLIDLLLEHNVCGTKRDSQDFRYEYLLVNPDENGNLRLHDYLWTGITDMKESLCIDLEKSTL